MKRRAFLAGLAGLPIAAVLPAWSAPVDPEFPYVVPEIEAMTPGQAARVRCVSLLDTPAERDAWLANERERALRPPRPYQPPAKLADYAELSDELRAIMRSERQT